MITTRKCIERQEQPHSPYNVIFSRKPPGSLTISRAELTNEEYSNPPHQHIEMKALDQLHQTMHEAAKKSNKVLYICKLSFDPRVKHTRQFSADDMVYVDSPPAPKCRQG